MCGCGHDGPQLMRKSLGGSYSGVDPGPMATQPRTAYARIRTAPETEVLAIAGRVGLIVGETQPSASGEPVIGDSPEDFALAVLLQKEHRTFWLRPELLEPVHRDGTPFIVERHLPWRERTRGAPHLRTTPVTRFLAWLEGLFPRLG